jgi:hypothetical protein
MGNIIGEGFAPEIIKQINVRQTIYGSVNRDNEQLSYLEARTGWCTLVSSVDVKSVFRNLPSYGDSLATEFVLWGGVTNERNRYGQSSFQRFGVWDGQDYIDVGDNRTSLDQAYNYYAYGVGGTEFGLKPMPGIKSASIKTETRGSLKTATVQIQANNRAQFDIIDTLYLRLGYTMLLEWGHSSYYDNDGNYIQDNPYSLSDTFLTRKNGNNILSLNSLQTTINSNRIKSAGNYDAVIGKVVNFNWTYTKEGTYDITLTLRSVGDVIESLKANLLLPGGSLNIPGDQVTPEDPENPTPNKLIEAFANTNEITKFFFTIQQTLKNEPVATNGMAVAKTDGIVDAVKQKYNGHGDEYYIRFGYFLNFLATKIIPYIDDNTADRLIYIDTNIESNIIYMVNRQISADPRICLFNTGFRGTQGSTSFFLSDAEPFEIEKNGNTYGKIMNAYFNMTWIITSMEELKDDKGKISLYDLIDALCKGWNQSTGNSNSLEPIIDSETNTIKIIDESPLPDKDTFLTENKLPTQLASFDVYGYYLGNGKDGYENNQYHAGFIKDLSFNTTVPPNLATMITVGATSQGYIVGQDATALSQMNAGLIDRWKPTINQPAPSGSASTSSLQQDYAGPLEAFNKYLANISSVNGGLPGWDEEIIDTFVSNQTQFLEYDQAKQTQARTGSASPSNGFLPFDLSLTMDGLSGMKIYQQFTIDSDFLPLNYPRSLNFLIKGITHDITSNQWNTTIESIAVSKNPSGTVKSRNIQISSTTANIPVATPPNFSAVDTATDLRTAIVETALAYARVQPGLYPIGGGRFNEASFTSDMQSVGYSGQAWCNLFTKLVWKKAYEAVGKNNANIKNIASSQFGNFSAVSGPIVQYVPTTFANMFAKGKAANWQGKNGLIKLVPGDMVIYDVIGVTGHQERDHIGIVVAVNYTNGTFTSVDGNFSNKVTQYTQPMDGVANKQRLYAVVKPIE